MTRYGRSDGRDGVIERPAYAIVFAFISSSTRTEKFGRRNAVVSWFRAAPVSLFTSPTLPFIVRLILEGIIRLLVALVPETTKKKLPPTLVPNRIPLQKSSRVRNEVNNLRRNVYRTS